jgi:hypothetical protein
MKGTAVSEADTFLEETVDGYAKRFLIPASNYLAAFIRTSLATLWTVVVAWIAARNSSVGDWLNDQSVAAQGVIFAFLVGTVNFVIAWAASKSIPLPNGRRLPLTFLGYLLIVNKKPDYQAGTATDDADASENDDLAEQTEKPDEGGEISQDPNEIFESEVEEEVN